MNSGDQPRQKMSASELRESWHQQARAFLDETTTAWVSVITGVDHTPRIMSASFVKEFDSEARAAYRTTMTPRFTGTPTTPVLTAAHWSRVGSGNILMDEAWGFSLVQIEMWRNLRSLGAEQLHILTTHSDSAVAAGIVEKLRTELSDIPDFNFEMLDAINAVIDRQQEILMELEAASEDAALCAKEHAGANSDLAALCVLLQAPRSRTGSLTPAPFDSRFGLDTSSEARERRFLGWVSNLSDRIPTMNASELGTSITARMLVERMVAERSGSTAL